MKVSVLIPLYNKAPYVREAVESVLHGEFGDLEVVVVDDASTDEGPAIVRAIPDARVRVIAQQRNGGPAAAANAGIDACRGEYIVRLDADDVNMPDRIARQVAYMDAHPEVGASGGALDLFGAQKEKWSFPLTDDECKAQLLFGVPVSQGTSILRRSVLERHHLRYDPTWPRVGEDWCFWARMAPFTRFGNLPDTLVLYRRGEQNISHGSDKVKSHRAILRRVFDLLALPATDADIDTHLITIGYFPAPPDARAVRRVRAWLDALVEMNAQRGLFPREAFERRVRSQWDRLYHRLPRFGWASALEHLRLSKHWPMDRLTYLAKVRVNTMLGRRP